MYLAGVMITNDPALCAPYQHSACHYPAHPTSSPDSSPPVTHSCHPIHHLTPSPIPVTCSCHLFLCSTLSHLVMCYACWSCVMHASMSSAQLFANSLSNHSHVARQALPAIVVTWVWRPLWVDHMFSKFYDTLYFLFAIIPYMFCPPSLD